MANQPTKYKKFLAGAASATLVATAIVPTALAAEVEKAATDFSDVAATHTHYAAIMQAVERELFNGYGDGTFKPENSIERKGVTKALANYVVAQSDYKTYEEYITANKLVETVTPFTDVPATHGDSELFNASLIVKDSGIFSGSNNNLMPNKNISRQQMAKVLVNGFGLKDLAGVESEVTDTDKAQAEYVNFINILSENDVTEVTTYNPTGDVKRGQMASFLNRAFDAAHKVVAPETATKVVSVSATNLKEAVVTFDGAVDEDTATDKANYAFKSGKAIKSVAISADKKSVTITLEGALTNNKTEALSVSNVKAGDNAINEKNIEFKVADNKLPEVSEIKSLGTKSVKVSFSEPVSGLQQSNFTLDGKAFFGKVDMGAGNKSAILTPYSTSALAVGDHSLTVSAVKDFAGFISLNSTHDFTVVEDKDAPTVTEATATLESVTLTFSEDVDASTVLASKVYWKSGDSKKTASEVEVLADNKFKFTFSTVSPDNSLPTGKVDIHVEGVKDYSGNEIVKDTKVSVTPEIDQTRPEVRKVTASSATAFKITFSKAIDLTSAEFEDNYTVKDKDGKVISVKTATLDADKKSVNVVLYSDLSVGENTLTVKNVKDATKLKNTMLDYTGTIVKGDATSPTFTKVVSVDNTRVVLSFDEKMDVETLADYSNYLVKIDNQLRTLTSDIAEISVINDGTAVSINFAERYDGKKVKFATGASTSTESHISEVHVLGLKDVAGNLLEEFKAANTTNVVPLQTATILDFANISTVAANAGLRAQLVDTETLKVKFNVGINSATSDAFTALDGQLNSIIESINVDGTSVVTIKLKKDKVGTDGTGLNLAVDFSELQTVAGKIDSAANNTIGKNDKLLDSVAPVVNSPSTAYPELAANQVVMTYSELLSTVAGAGQELLDKDFTIVRVSDNKELNANGDYDVTVGVGGDNTKVAITFTDGSTVKTAYKVTVNNAQYVKDAFGNKIANSTGQTVQLNAATGATGLTGVSFADVTGAGNDDKTKITLPVRTNGNTFKYLVSSNTDPVVAPVVGSALSSAWTAVVNNGVIDAANGKNIGVAEVTAAGKVVAFVNDTSVSVDHVAGVPGVKLADAALGNPVAFDTATDITLNGQEVVLTDVNTLGAAFDAAGNVAAVITALQADIDAVYDGTAHNAVTFTVAEGTGANAGKLVISSAGKVDLAGSDTATGATLLGFTTLTAVGSDAQN